MTTLSTNQPSSAPVENGTLMLFKRGVVEATSVEAVVLGEEGSCATVAVIRVRGHSLAVINTHVAWGEEHNPSQIAKALELVSGFQARSLPVLWCGDLNQEASSQEAKQLWESHQLAITVDARSAGLSRALAARRSAASA